MQEHAEPVKGSVTSLELPQNMKYHSKALGMDIWRLTLYFFKLSL
jgi:hypothetical protein